MIFGVQGFAFGVQDFLGAFFAVPGFKNFTVQEFRFGVSRSEFSGFQGSWFRVRGFQGSGYFGFRVRVRGFHGSGFQIPGFAFEVLGVSRFRVFGFPVRSSGFPVRG